jgi:polysaccharide biosynthesis protein PslJ
MFGLRLGFIVAALIVYLYVYNAARAGVGWDRLCRPLCFFWLGMVVLGWIGVFAPRFGMTTPVELLLPDSIAGDRGIQALVHAHATEFNPQSRNPYFRTAAPYAYTNNWGTGFAILVPCVVAYLTAVRPSRLRTVLIISLPVAAVPAFLTLNRGMFIGLGAGLIYLGVRALLRGDVRLIASIAGVAVLAWVVTLFVPVVDMITNRTENTDSTSDRADLYLQTMAAVMKSPLLGYGAPRLVDTTHGAEPLGTQGQVWMMMFSHGIPSLILFLLFFVLVAWRMSAAVSTPGKWLSTVPVIALVVTPFYGFSDINLTVMFYAIGLAVAALDGPVNRESADATTAPQNRAAIASA